MTYVLGIYRGHDASVALVGEGKIWHYEMERFTRIKHDGGNVDNLIRQIVRDAGIEWNEIVAVAGMGCSDDIGNTGHWRPCWDAQTGGLNAVDENRWKFQGIDVPCYYFPHHVAHAAYSFYTSQSETARTIVIDGGGDAWDDHDGKGQWVIDACAGVISQPFGSSECKWNTEIVPQVQIGGVWNDIADRLFDSWHCAGSVMALGGVPVGEHVSQETSSEIRALQDKTTVAFHRIADSLGQHRTIALGGGCALNGIAAYSLLKRDDVNTVHVPPAVHDGGLTVGAAMMVLHRVLGVPRVCYWHDVTAFAGAGIGDVDEVPIEEIVGRLVKGKVVALACGNAESGPRALGHRSFLADPRVPGIKDRLNQIKGRQPWRPVAPVILPEYGGIYFDLVNANCYNFMTEICDAKDRAKAEIPAAVHHDGTARVQVAYAWPLNEILRQFHEATGCPVLLNTSFNCKGEAMCNDAEQARDTFRRSGADVLVIGDKVEVG